jgi:hypothetical protein
LDYENIRLKYSLGERDEQENNKLIGNYHPQEERTRTGTKEDVPEYNLKSGKEVPRSAHGNH